MNDVAIIGVGLHPFGRFGAEVGHGDGGGCNRTRPRRRRDRVEGRPVCVRWQLEVVQPDAVTTLVGLTGIPFTDVFNACATAASAIELTANTISLGKFDIGVAVGMDKHPRGAFKADPAGTGCPGGTARSASSSRRSSSA